MPWSAKGIVANDERPDAGGILADEIAEQTLGRQVPVYGMIIDSQWSQIERAASSSERKLLKLLYWPPTPVNSSTCRPEGLTRNASRSPMKLCVMSSVTSTLNTVPKPVTVTCDDVVAKSSIGLPAPANVVGVRGDISHAIFVRVDVHDPAISPGSAESFTPSPSRSLNFWP